MPKKLRIMAGEDDDSRSRVIIISDLPDCILLHILSFLDAKSAVRTAALSRRWQNLWKEVVVLDRLSGLPDYILHHILSSLCSDVVKAAGQTSVLSRRWTNLWKRASVLHNLRASSFRTRSNLQKFLRSLGSQYPVGTIGFTFDNRPSSGRLYGLGGIMFMSDHHRMVFSDEDIELFDMVMEYAARLRGCCRDRRLEVLSITADDHRFDQLARPITLHRHHESLKTLKLSDSKLDPPGGIASLGLAGLTTLELRGCELTKDSASRFGSTRDQEEIYDPFADLPSLSSLKLLYCSSGIPLWVSGDRLSSLEIVLFDRASGSQFDLRQLLAPKLESLYLSGHVYGFWPLQELYLPSLAHASVRLVWTNLVDCLNSTVAPYTVNQKFIKLLRGLFCTKSLTLDFEDKSRDLRRSPLVRMKPLIEREIPHFIRLMNLKIQYPTEIARNF